MTAAVAVVGDLPATGIIPNPVAWRVPASVTPADLLSFQDGAESVLRSADGLVVVCPTRWTGVAHRLVRYARGILHTDRIAVVPLDLPPLALSVVSDQLAFAGLHLRPGALAGLAEALCDRVVAGAWLNSVARLEPGRTRLAQHLRSYLPGTGFGVIVGATDAATLVHSVRKKAPVPPLPRLPSDPVLMIAAESGGDMAWLRDSLVPAAHVVQLTAVAASPEAPSYWGARKFVEFVAFSGYARDLDDAYRTLSLVSCPWCGAEVAGPTCVFCARTAPGAAASTPILPPPVSRPSAQPIQPGAAPTAQPEPAAQPVANVAAAPIPLAKPAPAAPPVVEPVHATRPEPVPTRSAPRVEDPTDDVEPDPVEESPPTRAEHPSGRRPAPTDPNPGDHDDVETDPVEESPPTRSDRPPSTGRTETVTFRIARR